ncbi:MAG: DUF192 domain-containing protein [Granulosicoccaceae bacterium]
MAIKFNSRILLNDKPLAVELCVAAGFVARLRGLLFTDSLSPNHGMYIKSCSEVHSFGMAYPLDIVFLDNESKIIRVDILPRHSMRRCRDATAVIELSEGSVEILGMKLGDLLSFCSQSEFEEVLS